MANMKIFLRSFIILSAVFILLGCDSTKLQETPIENFIGVWELKGREMFDDMRIIIEKTSEGQLIGKVAVLNDNKYVDLFVEKGDLWITGIKRKSNYEFTLSEKRIGSALFAQYGQETTDTYTVQFIDNNTFALEKGNGNPQNSNVIYKKVNF